MEHEALLRLVVFVTLFALLAITERLVPRRARQARIRDRWVTNWAIVLLDTATLRLLAIVLPLLAVGAAMDAQALGWGLFNGLNWPVWVEALLAILILDFAIWAQHVLTHRIPFLWRIHRVHHADIDMDVTTAIRFHPIEILISMLLKIGLVYLLGPAVWAVILFEILLNGSALFNHSNINLGRRLDAVLRLAIVTPDMHRVHHSVSREEHDTNYGFALSLWDRFFGTYRAQPVLGHDRMRIGLDLAQAEPAKLGWSLLLPFRS